MMDTPQAITEDAARYARSRLQAAWEEGDMTAIDEVFADGLIYHQPPFPDMGRTELKEFVAAFRTGFHSFRVTPDEDFVSGAISVHRWHVEGTFAEKTPLLTSEATGRRTTTSGAFIFHWFNDKVTEAWQFADWLGWLIGAGVLPPIAGRGQCSELLP